MRGNPNWIEAGWGEQTKCYKLPVRIGERIRELHNDGVPVDEIVNLLRGELEIRGYIGDWLHAIESGKIRLNHRDKAPVRRFLEELVSYVDNYLT